MVFTRYDLLSEKKTRCSYSVLAAAAKAQAEAEAVAAAAVVTAAAGHTRRGPGQRPCARVSWITPLKVATYSSSFRFFLEGGQSSSPIIKTHPTSEARTPPPRSLQQICSVPPSVRWAWQYHLQHVSGIWAQTVVMADRRTGLAR